MCILRNLPSRRTLGRYAEGAPPILYVSKFPWKYFFFVNGKKREEIKKRVGSITRAFF
jgi:hypothetical protein